MPETQIQPLQHGRIYRTIPVDNSTNSTHILFGPTHLAFDLRHAAAILAYLNLDAIIVISTQIMAPRDPGRTVRKAFSHPRTTLAFRNYRAFGEVCYRSDFTSIESPHSNARFFVLLVGTPRAADLKPHAFISAPDSQLSHTQWSATGEATVHLKTRCSLLYRQVTENTAVVHAGLSLYMLWGFIQALLRQRAGAVNALSQTHRTARLRWMKQMVESYVIRNRCSLFRDQQPSVRPDIRKYFGRRLLVLKPPLPAGERGVLFVSFSDMFRLLPLAMNVEKLLEDYTFVFEPSYPGFCHPALLRYTRWSEQIFVLAASQNDFAFLQRLGSNLIPINMGPADWVDPRISLPYLGKPKEFDILMNSGWMALKRHYVLFRMLARAKREYKVALIGFGGNRRYIEDLAAYYAIGDQLTIFEDIPYERVMDVTCRSRVSVLLSLKEGGNRAIVESMFCDVPVVLLSNHIGGVKKNVTRETGLLADERDLQSALDQLINSDIRPRAWAVENISCFKSSEKLNVILREHALGKGRPWTQDIVRRSNSPDSSYTCSEDAERLRPWNEGLSDYLR